MNTKFSQIILENALLGKNFNTLWKASTASITLDFYNPNLLHSFLKKFCSIYNNAFNKKIKLEIENKEFKNWTGSRGGENFYEMKPDYYFRIKNDNGHYFELFPGVYNYVNIRQGNEADITMNRFIHDFIHEIFDEKSLEKFKKKKGTFPNPYDYSVDNILEEKINLFMSHSEEYGKNDPFVKTPVAYSFFKHILKKDTYKDIKNWSLVFLKLEKDIRKYPNFKKFFRQLALTNWKEKITINDLESKLNQFLKVNSKSLQTKNNSYSEEQLTRFLNNVVILVKQFERLINSSKNKWGELKI